VIVSGIEMIDHIVEHRQIEEYAVSIHRRVVVLAEPLGRGQEIVGFLTNSTTDGIACASSDELSRVVNEGRTDAIVIDHRLSGFLNGIDIVQRMSRDLVRPVTILVGDLNAEEKELASRLKISALLPASTAPEAISAAALETLTQEIHGGLSIPHGARILVRDGECVAPLPQLLVRLAEFLGNPNATFGELAKEILSDAQITAELLKIVNNAAMGLSGKIAKVEEAIKLIGIKRTVALVLSRHLLGSQQRRTKPLPEDMEQKLRQRSVLTASTAATYARMTGSPAADTAYLLGLLQDLGILILLHQVGAKYFQTLERCAAISQLQLVAYERQELGFTHADVSAAVMQKWELSPRLIRLVLQHHAPIETVQSSAVEIDLVKAMQIGEAFADCREQSTAHRKIFLNRLVSRFGQMDVGKFRVCLAQSVDKTLEMSQIFDVPVPDETALQHLVSRLADEIDFRLPEAEAAPEGVERSASAMVSVNQSGQQLEVDRAAPSTAVRSGFHAAPPRGSMSESPLAVPESPYIVVVDDEPTIPRLIARMLSHRGIHVAECAHFAQVAPLAENAVAILCDVHLGRESGIDFVRQLRDLGIRTPVIMMSGDRRRGTVMESIGAGIAAYVPKPFDQQTLLSKLEPYFRYGDNGPLRANSGRAFLEAPAASQAAARHPLPTVEPVAGRTVS